MSTEPSPPITPLNDAPRSPGPPPREGKAIASLVLGICSAILWLCPLVGLATSIVGLVLGLQARKERRSGMATAGIVLSSIGLGLTAINGAAGAYMGATGGFRFLKPKTAVPAPTPAPKPLPSTGE